jgi:hypothetical protein
MMLSFQRREHGGVARRLFFKNVGDGRDDDAAAADGAQFADGLRQAFARHDDGDGVPILIRFARDDGADGGTLQTADGCFLNSLDAIASGLRPRMFAMTRRFSFARMCASMYSSKRRAISSAWDSFARLCDLQ